MRLSSEITGHVLLPCKQVVFPEEYPMEKIKKKSSLPEIAHPAMPATFMFDDASKRLVNIHRQLITTVIRVDIHANICRVSHIFNQAITNCFFIFYFFLFFYFFFIYLFIFGTLLCDMNGNTDLWYYKNMQAVKELYQTGLARQVVVSSIRS